MERDFVIVEEQETNCDARSQQLMALKREIGSEKGEDCAGCGGKKVCKGGKT